VHGLSRVRGGGLVWEEGGGRVGWLAAEPAVGPSWGEGKGLGPR
jgi:hypothetical protein